MENCKGCMFFDNGFDDIDGFCTRYPPNTFIKEHESFDDSIFDPLCWHYPHVHQKNWCGEFKSKKRTVAFLPSEEELEQYKKEQEEIMLEEKRRKSILNEWFDDAASQYNNAYTNSLKYLLVQTNLLTIKDIEAALKFKDLTNNGSYKGKKYKNIGRKRISLLKEIIGFKED